MGGSRIDRRPIIDLFSDVRRPMRVKGTIVSAQQREGRTHAILDDGNMRIGALLEPGYEVGEDIDEKFILRMRTSPDRNARVVLSQVPTRYSKRLSLHAAHDALSL